MQTDATFLDARTRDLALVRMEHLWSQAGATGGKRWQMPGSKRAQIGRSDGKEGVDGSSPSEGFCL